MPDPEIVVYTNYRDTISYQMHEGRALIAVDDLNALMLETGYFNQADADV